MFSVAVLLHIAQLVRPLADCSLLIDLAAFPILQSLQRVLRFEIVLGPPLESGILWSTCKVNLMSVAGERPQILHLNLSRLKTSYRIPFVINLLLLFKCFALWFGFSRGFSHEP